jgi:hypothetical protein
MVAMAGGQGVYGEQVHSRRCRQFVMLKDGGGRLMFCELRFLYRGGVRPTEALLQMDL